MPHLTSFFIINYHCYTVILNFVVGIDDYFAKKGLASNNYRKNVFAVKNCLCSF